MTHPGWTDQRVTDLRRLWADGLSASQIATRLGGCTRNAVIGKVHRLGLPGRATTVRMKSSRPRKARTKAPGGWKPLVFGNGGAKPAPYREPVEELVIPPAERVAMGDLESVHCRWPFGDPREDGFAFCGRPVIRGRSYCDYHNARSCRGTR